MLPSAKTYSLISLALPPATPVWGSSAPPPSVFRPAGKRVQMGSNSPPTASNRFVSPRDLALHLARVHPSRPHPLALPRSAIRYCLRVDYGRLFPYANKAIIDLATTAFAPAGFIDFRPFKGYFDVGFQSEEDAEVAAQTPLIYKKTPIPTTRTRLPSDTMLVVSFANLPSHLPPQVLYDQLVAGLMAYGTQATLIFAIPSGAERLAAPRATATIIPYHPTIAQQIPPRASVAAAPDHFFWAQVNNGRQICSLCFGLDHAKKACPKAKSAAAASEPPSGGSVWGALLPPPTLQSRSVGPHGKSAPPKTSILTLPPKSTPANQSNAWTNIHTQAAAYSPNPTHSNLNNTTPVNQNAWDLLAETDESGNVLISKHTGQPLCHGNYGWAEFFLPNFDENPTPRHFAPLPNTPPSKVTTSSP
ncbi:hypothetical protein L0F63_004429 [Massospora cicadina]|nr:hypothetical protein L0F63_004429 [Massospora cicadina]